MKFFVSSSPFTQNRCYRFSFPPQRWSSVRRPSSITPGRTATPSPANLRWDAETPPRRLQRPPGEFWFAGVRSACPPSTKSVQSRPTRSRTAAASRQRETAGQTPNTEHRTELCTVTGPRIISSLFDVTNWCLELFFLSLIFCFGSVRWRTEIIELFSSKHSQIYRLSK